MAVTIIIICLLLLLAYVFEIISRIIRTPSIILLLLLGLASRQAVDFFQIEIPSLAPLLPFLGTFGLILIVLEGSLEIELNKSKMSLIKKSFIVASAPMFVMTILLALAFQYYGQVSYKVALLNAIPFCVISSAIAIPSVKYLSSYNKEFVIYDSSLSDIFGVLLFNFIVLNEYIGIHSFGNFALQIIVITFISFIAVLGLSFLLSRINHQITFTPIILFVILIYAISKVYHLPGLIFILVFGLFLGNLNEMKNYSWIEKLRPEKLDKEVIKFKDFTIETTFIIKSLFFILFGFLLEANEILNFETIPWAIAIVFSILVLRLVTFAVLKIPVNPLLFVAPRGLITILLFLSIVPSQSIPVVNKSLVIQVIILSVLVMMLGLMTNKSTPAVNETN